MSTDGTPQTPSPPVGKSTSGPIDDFLGMIAQTIIKNRLANRENNRECISKEDPSKPNENDSL